LLTSYELSVCSHILVEELDDESYSDVEEEMTAEQQGALAGVSFPEACSCQDLAQMATALDSVRAILGDEEVCGLPDADIQNYLWDAFFNVEETIQWGLGACISATGRKPSHLSISDEIQRRNVARERKGELLFQNLLFLPFSIFRRLVVSGDVAHPL